LPPEGSRRLQLGTSAETVMFSNRDPDHNAHGIRITRDVVEIVAIIAAGLWAFYVFAYENRIKPSFANPQVEFNATMSRVGERNGFVAIRLDSEIRNVGQVRAHLIGYGMWVYGRRIAPLQKPRGASGNSRSLGLDGAFYRLLPRTPVYGYGYITVLGDPKTTSDLNLQPGDDIKSQNVFFVPINRFDMLDVYIHARYTKKDEHVIPTKLVLDSKGLPKFIGEHEDNSDFSNFVSSLSLL